MYRLSELRDKCRKAPECPDGTHSVAVVRDREHLAAVREARDNAKHDLLAVCDLLGPAGETSVFIPSQEAAASGVKVKLIYNTLARTVSPEKRDLHEKELSAVGIELFPVANVHAKFMTWDDDAILVTSFNWLATTPDPWKPRGSEIGVLVKGPGLVESLRARFSQAAEIADEGITTQNTCLEHRRGNWCQNTHSSMRFVLMSEPMHFLQGQRGPQYF